MRPCPISDLQTFLPLLGKKWVIINSTTPSINENLTPYLPSFPWDEKLLPLPRTANEALKSFAFFTTRFLNADPDVRLGSIHCVQICRMTCPSKVSFAGLIWSKTLPVTTWQAPCQGLWELKYTMKNRRKEKEEKGKREKMRIVGAYITSGI